MRTRETVIALGISALVAFHAPAQPVGPLFPVNASPVGDQDAASAALDDAGGFVVAWQTGPATPDPATHSVTVRRFSPTAQPLEAELVTLGSSMSPSVGSDAAGNFVVAYTSGAAALRQISAVRFSSSGTALGGSFVVSTAPASLMSYPDVAMAPSGDYVVAWHENTQVQARRFSAAGTAQGSDFRVSAAQAYGGPEVSTDASGNFVVVWTDNATRGAFARRYASDGTPLGGPFPFDAGDHGPFPDPDVAHDVAGGFYVVWLGGSVGPGNIRVRHYRANGALDPLDIHANLMASPGRPSIATGPNGGFLVGWDGGGDMRFRFYGSQAQPMLGELSLGPSEAEGVASNRKGRFVVLKRGADGDAGGIFGARAVSPLEAIQGEFRANTTTSTAQKDPSVAEAADGSFLVVWDDASEGFPQVRAQRFDAQRAALGGEMRLSNGINWAHDPSAAALPSGFVVAWTDLAGGGAWGRRIDASGSAGTQFRVDDAGSFGGSILDPKLASDANGGFVAVYPRYFGNLQIQARRFDATGAPLGGEFRVNTTTSGDQKYASVGSGARGDFVVVWRGPSAADVYDILGQRYSSTGAKLGGEFRVNESTTGVQSRPSVSKDQQGNFVVAWDSYVAGASLTEIRARRYTSDGSALTGDFAVNSITTGHQERPAVAHDAAGGFTVAWTGPDGAASGVFTRRFDWAGGPLGDDIRANTTTTGAKSGAALAIGKSTAVLWASLGQDGSDDGVYGQVYRAPCRSSDANGDGAITVADVFHLINYLFAGGTAPACGGDANADAAATVADVFYLISYLFAGGPPPA